MKFQPNGCGPKGLVGKLIPDSLFGVSVNAVCNSHDELYSKGGGIKERKKADEKFLSDMLSMIETTSGSKLTKLSRKASAYLYYYFVRLFGALFFNHKGKNE